jgi:hypothetical protein
MPHDSKGGMDNKLTKQHHRMSPTIFPCLKKWDNNGFLKRSIVVGSGNLCNFLSTFCADFSYLTRNLYLYKVVIARTNQ